MKRNGASKTTTSVVTTVISRPHTPDKMVTLACGSCRMALYMSEKKLTEPTWKCPSCGAITRTSERPVASAR